MIKNKYQRMNKDQRNAIKNAYFATKDGQNNKIRLLRIIIIGIFCEIYSLYLAIETYIKHNNILLLVYSALIFISGLVLIIGYFKVKCKILNKFAIDHDIK